MKKITLLWLCISSFAFHQLHAQITQNTPLGLNLDSSQTISWIGLQADRELGSKMFMSTRIQRRSKENLSTLNYYFGENTFSYKPFKHWNLDVGARYSIRKSSTGSPNNRLLYYEALTYRYQMDALTFSHKVRLEHEKYLQSPQALNQTLRLYNSVHINLRNSNLDPTLIVEQFRYWKSATHSGVKKWRYAIATNIPMGLDKLTLTYMLISKKDSPDKSHVLGCFYKFKW